MRNRHLLVACTTGVAVCLVLIGFQQSPPIDDRTRAARFGDGINDDQIDSDAADTAAGGGAKPFRYQSLRYNGRMPDETSNDRDEVRMGRDKLKPTTVPEVVQPSPRAFADGVQGSRARSWRSSGGRLRRHKFVRNRTEEAPNWRTTVYYDPESPPEDFLLWNKTATALCNPPPLSASSPFRSRTGDDRGAASQLIAYGNLFAELREVVIDRKFCLSKRLGGELVADVMNQEEEDEYYKVKHGCFQLACNSLPQKPDGFRYDFRGTAHLDDWLHDGIRFANDNGKAHMSDAVDRGDNVREAVFDGFTVAVVRYEYANLYHTTTDWYNAFLMMQFFGRTPAETNILLIDSHPFGALDSVWMRLFGSVTRLSALGRRTRFRQLVWNIVGYESPLTIYASSPYPPLFNAFRRHVLSSYNINPTTAMAAKDRNCSALNVLFLWRRDYLAHPRNPTGRVQRKIANERELIEFVQRRRPAFRVSGVQIDLLDVGDQLRRILAADIVVGVHGAGLTHAAFMRPDSGLAEIYPNEVWAANEHFQAIAGWRGIQYVRWVNHDFGLEDEAAGTLRVPPYVANGLVGSLARKLCSPGGTRRSSSSNSRRKSSSELETSPAFGFPFAGGLPGSEFDLVIGDDDGNDDQGENQINSDDKRRTGDVVAPRRVEREQSLNELPVDGIAR